MLNYNPREIYMYTEYPKMYAHLLINMLRINVDKY
jgi:hypothetical protein